MYICDDRDDNSLHNQRVQFGVSTCNRHMQAFMKLYHGITCSTPFRASFTLSVTERNFFSATSFSAAVLCSFLYTAFFCTSLFATGVKAWLLFARMHTLPLASLRHAFAYGMPYGVLCCRFQACFKLVTQHINIKLLLYEWNEVLLQLRCQRHLMCFSLLNIILNSGIWCCR